MLRGDDVAARDPMIERQAAGREDRHRPHRAEDVVEKGFRTLLDPAGDEMKVMVSVA